jgi:predicted Rossmann fold nucleotide-binding protein DprA/Smf involved in DNA uptake
MATSAVSNIWPTRRLQEDSVNLSTASGITASADTAHGNGRSAPYGTDIGDDEREHVLSALGPTPASVDDVARACGLPVSVVQAVILELAIAGRIDRHGTQLVSLAQAPG